MIAVWIAYRKAVNESNDLQSQLTRLQAIARELRIESPDEFAVVSRLPTRYGEMIWDIYVPGTVTLETTTSGETARQTEICLAMDGIPPKLDQLQDIPLLESVILPPGTHTLELSYERSDEIAELLVKLDGQVVITIQRPKDWESGTGWSSSGSQTFETSTSLRLDEPLVLHERRFMRDVGNGSSASPNEPCEGILLWVQSR